MYLSDPLFDIVNAVGAPISGAKARFYLTQTTNNATTYSDSALTTPNTNPVIADSAGRFPPIYLNPDVSYRLQILDASNVLIVDRDPIYTAGESSDGDSWLVLSNVAALQAKTGSPSEPELVRLSYNHVEGDGGGVFYYDASDTTTADNGGTVIVDAASKRWKRQYSGPLNANWFGDLSSAFTASVQAAITAAGTYGTVQIPYGSYSLTGTLSLQTGQTLEGIGGKPTITRAFAGTMINAAPAYTRLRFLNIAGVGGTYTNTSTDIAILYNTLHGFQSAEEVQVSNNAGPCVQFSVADAAYSSTFRDCTFTRTTTTNPAIVFPTSVDSTGGREFHGCRGGGGWLMRFNSGINTRVIGGDTVNLDFSGSEGVSLRTIIDGMRIATGGSNFTLYGNDSIITGCIIAGPGVITGAASRNSISGNVLSAGSTWTDNSTSTGTNVNNIDYARYTLDAVSPTTEWGADGTAPTLGNGTLASQVVRQGRVLAIDIFLTIGSTTTVGTSNWYFKLPAPFDNWNARNLTVGVVRILDSGTTWLMGTAWVAAGTNKIYMSTASSGSQIGAGAPITWAAGDSLALHIEYEIS
jgi:hypothetical protein